MYKVFLVEDEIVTREGIRDNVNWASVGFEFCGEAPDGELALPLIEETNPDVLISDIKMPFMDGLQLSKIIREHMPWVKIIILSGHDEFNYAQSALKLGVTDYLLKPVSAHDLENVLQTLSEKLDREKLEREKLKSLQSMLEDNLVLNREKFLLKLVMGGVSPTEAIEQSEQLGLNIIAKYYLVIFVRIELCEESKPFEYHEYQQVEGIISNFARQNIDIFLTKKDLEELVLLLKSDDLEQLVQEGSFLADLIKAEVENQTPCKVVIRIGTPQGRLGDIRRSFADALTSNKPLVAVSPTSQIGPDRVDLIKIDSQAIENYLKFGAIQDFDEFFVSTLQQPGHVALQSNLMKHYMFVDIILMATQFMCALSDEVHPEIPEIQEIEEKLVNINSIEAIKSVMKKIFEDVLSFRNDKINRERFGLIQHAKAFIESHFSDPEFQMNKVATNFNLSPSHFSTIFHQKVGETFQEYVSRLRINRAKELLGTTNIKISEVSYHSGYSDPHYFSYVFKKNTGRTPKQFRSETQDQ